MKKIGEHLGLSQTDMAKLIGSNKTTGSLYENGSRQLNARELNSLTGIEILMAQGADIQRHHKINLNEQRAMVAMLRKLAADHKMATFKCDVLRMKLAKMEKTYPVIVICDVCCKPCKPTRGKWSLILMQVYSK